MFFSILTIIFLFFSVVGYGFFLKKIFFKNYTLEFGLIGILGVISLTFYSYFTNFFFSHSGTHNLTLHIVGLFLYIYFIFINKKKVISFYLIITILIFIPAIFISKSHDDFPYYHLPYIVNLVENKIFIGNGNFSLAHRTHSSIFYLSSLFYLPVFGYKLINFSYYSVLIFSNIYIFEKLINKEFINKGNFIFYLHLFFFIFINIVFYRISEFGTDRTGQIFLLFIFIYFYNIIYEFDDIHLNFKLLSIFLVYLITIKSYFLTYLVLPLFLFVYLIKKKKFVSNLIFNSLNYFLIFIILIYLFKNFLNNGCLIYPLYFTCFENFLWSQPLSDTKYLNNWYELWAKAGAGPNFRIDNPQVYVEKFNWVSNWFSKYFFNKVSDFILGVILICLIMYFSFFTKLKINNNRNFFLPFSLLVFIFMVWFFNHPSLRYGGFTLIALLFFFPLSIIIEKNKISFLRKKIVTTALIFLTIFIFEYRNINRIKNEIIVYNYNLLAAPFDFIKEIPFSSTNQNNFEINNPLQQEMCWAIKSPCTYRKDLLVQEFYKYKIFYRKKNN